MSDENKAIRTSYSSLNMHRKCPQAWKYSRLDKLGADEGTHARDAGTWWQALRVAESLERGRAAESLRSIPKKIKTADDGPVFNGETMTVVEVQAGLQSWWDKQSLSYREAAISYLGFTMPYRLEVAMASWKEFFEDELENEEPIGLEIWWSRKLPHPKNAPDDEKDVSIGGFIDEVYFDRRREMLVIRDNKFTKNISKSTQEDMMDSQLQLYAWGAQPLIKKWNFSRLGAVSFDRAQSVMKEPRITKTGSLSKQVTAFDKRIYLDWVGEGVPFPGMKKDGSGAGVYQAEDKVVERLDGLDERSRWFERTLVPMNRNLLATHLRSAVSSSQDIQRTMERIERYGEAQRNLTNMCSWCEFAKLCRAQMVGGPEGDYGPADYGLILRK